MIEFLRDQRNALKDCFMHVEPLSEEEIVPYMESSLEIYRQKYTRARAILHQIDTIIYQFLHDRDHIMEQLGQIYNGIIQFKIPSDISMDDTEGLLNLYPGVAVFNTLISRLELLIDNTIDELKLITALEEKADTGSKPQTPATTSNRIFIVHGHDEEIKQATARMLERLDLEAIILHEQPNKGKTIIEKFTEYSDVGFAVVLLTPDDVGRSYKTPSETEKFRARQNVILELGYFLGKLGRNRVFVLFREQENFEMPSDYNGVIYTPYDNGNLWAFALAKELKEAHYAIDVNKIL